MVTVSVNTPCVQNLRANLQQIMGALGLNQGELADRAGITRVYVNRILTAKCVPSLDMVGVIADALGTEVEVLVRDPSKTSRKNLSKAS